MKPLEWVQLAVFFGLLLALTPVLGAWMAKVFKGEWQILSLPLGWLESVTKPFHTEELLARLRVARRHAAAPEPGQTFSHVGLVVDLVQRTVTVKGQSIDLTPTEYSLLRLLVVNAGKVLAHAHILREIWGAKSTEQAQYLRVFVSQLRAKLAAAGFDKSIIKTESGVGYRFIQT